MAQQRGGGMGMNADPFKPTDAANSPVGVAKGIHPGRVAWVQDAKATSWDGATGHWWDDANTDQTVVHRMTSQMLLNLTGRKNDKQAWDALFRSFNETHKLGHSGYRPGRRSRSRSTATRTGLPSGAWGRTHRPRLPTRPRAALPRVAGDPCRGDR